LVRGLEKKNVPKKKKIFVSICAQSLLKSKEEGSERK